MAATGLVGCAGETPPGCSEGVAVASGAGAVPSATATVSAARSAGPQAMLGKDGARLVLSVAGAGDDRVLAVEAVHGSIDEPIVVIAAPVVQAIQGAEGAAAPAGASVSGAPPAPAAPARESVEIAVSSAFAGGDAPVPLRLTNPATGQDVPPLEMSPGQHVLLRLTGEGFTREATYRANLTLLGAEPAVYRLRIKSTQPHRPLGLRAAKWADTFSDVPILSREAVRLMLPVDAPGEGTAPYHVVVKPAAQPEDNTKPLPACGIVVRPAGNDHAVSVELPPLDPGRYTGILEIQGEPLAVDVTLKNSFWWVWLLVAAGAGLSLGLREYVRYRAAREAAERKIGAKEREIDRRRDAMIAWDELCVRNALRASRGRKSYLGLDDVDELLADAAPRERPERVAIDRALGETPLPAPLRAVLRARLARLSYLCARADAAEIDRGLAELSRSAQAGFSSELLEWLAELREQCFGTADRIAPLLLREKLQADPVARARVEAAMRVLGQLVDDARALALDSGLSAGQAELVAMVGAALHQLEVWVREEQVPAQIVEIIHADLGALSRMPEPDGQAAAVPKGLRLRARGVGRDLNALEEITFELVGPSGDLDGAALHVPHEAVTWLVDRTEVVGRGGPRLTYVFEAARGWGFRERTVTVKLGDRLLAEQVFEVLPAPRSAAAIERIWASGARLAATMVGVIVAGAAAVGLYWSGKPFGGGADYVAALLTGLGADLTVVAGGGKLLQSVLDSVTKRRSEE